MQEQKFARDIPHKITRWAAANNKVAHKPHGAGTAPNAYVTLDQRASFPTAGQEKRSVWAQNCEDARDNEGN